MASALVVFGLLLVPAPGVAWSGFGGDLSIENLMAVWSHWFGGSDPSTILSKGSVILDPDGNPVDSEGNKPSDEPPAAAAVEISSPELAAVGGD
jgi:hypothetical protein